MTFFKHRDIEHVAFRVISSVIDEKSWFWRKLDRSATKQKTVTQANLLAHDFVIAEPLNSKLKAEL